MAYYSYVAISSVTTAEAVTGFESPTRQTFLRTLSELNPATMYWDLAHVRSKKSSA